MPVIWCKTWYRINSYCDHKSCLNRDVSTVPLLNWKKIESHFETWNSDAQRINLTFVAYSLVANFVRYISAKYYINWFSFHTVIMKVLGVNFFLKHSVERRQAAADPQTKPNDLDCESVGCQSPYPPSPFVLLLSPKADTQFTVPRRVEGWVDLVGWLHTKMVYPPADGHPSWY